MKKAAWKTLSALVALMLIVTVLPALTGQTAKAESKIVDNIEVWNLIKPTIGGKPDSFFQYKGDGVKDSEKSGDNWSRGVLWTDEATKKSIAYTETFAAGHSYSVTVEFFATGDYTFSESTKVRLSGNDAEVTLISSTQLHAKYTFPKLTSYVGEIRITDLDAPKVAKTPDYDVTVNTTKVTLEKKTDGTWKNGVQWFNVTDNVAMKPTDTYEDGKEYQVSFALVLGDGYNLLYPSGGESVILFVNGNYSNKYKDYDPESGSVCVYYQFPMLYAEMISDVLITDLDEPKMGETPDYDVTMEAEHTRKEKDDDFWKNGIKWYDVTAQQDLKPTDTFIGGHVYQVFVSLTADAGYAFLNKWDSPGHIYINNKNVKIEKIEDSRSNIVINYMFPKVQEEYIKRVAITLSNPKVGETPDYDVTVDVTGMTRDDTTDEVWENGVYWEDLTARNVMKPDDKFEPSHRYAVYVAFHEVPGYSFDLHKIESYTINGNEAGVQRLDGKLILNYRSFSMPDGILQVFVNDVDAPVPGATPDYDVTVTGEGAVLNAFSEPGGVKNGVLWIDDGTYMSPDAVFKAGRAYTVRVFVNPVEGYTFFEGDEFATRATINGEAAELHRYETPESVYFSYTFPAQPGAEEPGEPTVKLISSVDIAITPPEAGQNPSFDVTLTGEGCRMAEDGNENWVHGVMFMDRTTYSTVTATDVFQEDETYEAHFSLIADEGYSFFNDANELVTTFTINGEAPWNVGGYDPYAPRHIFVRGLFPMSGKAHLFPTEVVSFFPYEGGLFFVSGGDVVTDANGLVEDPNSGAWYFCAAGQAQLQYSGLAEYDGEWFYLENGKLDTVRAGLVEYDGGRFMIAAGRILREVDGLIQEPNTGLWYYVAAGQVADYTGLVQYDGAWFYVINGELATDFTGEVEYDGAMFSVVNGEVA